MQETMPGQIALLGEVQAATVAEKRLGPRVHRHMLLQQVNPHKHLAAALTLMLLGRRMVHRRTVAQDVVRIDAVLQRVHLHMALQIAAQRKGFAALRTQKGLPAADGGGVSGVGMCLGAMGLHQILRGKAFAADVAAFAHPGTVDAAMFAQFVLTVVLHAALRAL